MSVARWSKKFSAKKEHGSTIAAGTLRVPILRHTECAGYYRSCKFLITLLVELVKMAEGPAFVGPSFRWSKLRQFTASWAVRHSGWGQFVRERAKRGCPGEQGWSYSPPSSLGPRYSD